jgi:hypothetical protein
MRMHINVDECGKVGVAHDTTMVTWKVVASSLVQPLKRSCGATRFERYEAHQLSPQPYLVVAHALPSDMSNYLPTINYLPFDGGLGQISSNGESPNSVALIPLTNSGRIEPSTSNGPHLPIHTLNDDVLLNIFQLYRLDLADLDEYDDEIDGLMATETWSRQRWWYNLSHVCRLWRNIILASPSQLDLHLPCTNGVPVADMLANSPPLPLLIFYEDQDRKITPEDESSILLALSHRDRVRRISFWMLPNSGTFVTVMDDQFPILERMYIHSRTEVVLPVTFQAPNLRHLMLSPASIQIRSPLLTATVGLVTLELTHIPASAYFPPSYILTRLSLMLQLERLAISFQYPIPNRDVEGQLVQAPIIAQVTLSGLRLFVFRGTSAYLEGLVSRMIAPSLSILEIYLFNHLSFTIPRLLQFMQSSENLRFNAVDIRFGARLVELQVMPWTSHPSLRLRIGCEHLDWQVASVAQIFHTLSPVLSVVEKVRLTHEEHNQSSESHNDVDRTQWRELLRPFANAKAIHVQEDFVDKISRSLPSHDGDPFLPNLKEIQYSGARDSRDAFTAFLDERQVAGRPVSLRLVDLFTFYNDEEMDR